VLLALVVAALGGTPTVDAVAWVVGDRVITRSDLALEAELAEIDVASVPPWRDRARPAQERLVEGALLRAAAGDVPVYAPSDADVRGRVERMRDGVGAVGWNEFLQRWGLDERAVYDLTRRRMVVERYVIRTLSTRAATAGVRLDLTAAGWDEGYPALVAEIRDRVSVRAVGSAP
jgi:hypothetical protein